uniref:RING-type E3 ubiquitin transferase n=1 Tax=Erpetoichthys calabaricus TaxID=27687 RepID=A0A8C4SJG7_ERPCA
MPVQAAQWTEFLSCPICYNEFDENVHKPISLGCSHTVCKTCLNKLHRKACPFDQTVINTDIDILPVNFALLQLVGAQVPDQQTVNLSNVAESKHYEVSKKCIEELALYLKPISGGKGIASLNQSALSRPMQRKLVTLVNCQMVEEEGRVRAMRAARSLGERTVTELILQHQNPQQLSANLWAAVRARGCQFLGPAMQEDALKLVLLALEDGSALSRKVLVLFVVQKLEARFPQASKTSIGHVVQLLYRASCFKVTKRDEDSSLMQLKEEFRTYEALRREHDAQIVHIAMEAGLRISPEQWSSLLYGDLAHKSHMQSIIDKLQSPESFAKSVQELTIVLQRTGDPANLNRLRPHLELLANIDHNPDAELPTWEQLENVMVAVKTVVHGLVDFIQNFSKKSHETPQPQPNSKYKTSMCRDLRQQGGCPRGGNCTFAHSQEELEKYRMRNKKISTSVRPFPLSQPSFLNKSGINDSASSTAGTVISIIGNSENMVNMIRSTNGVAHTECSAPQLISRGPDPPLEELKKLTRAGSNGLTASGCLSQSPSENSPPKTPVNSTVTTSIISSSTAVDVNSVLPKSAQFVSRSSLYPPTPSEMHCPDLRAPVSYDVPPYPPNNYYAPPPPPPLPPPTVSAAQCVTRFVRSSNVPDSSLPPSSVPYSDQYGPFPPRERLTPTPYPPPPPPAQYGPPPVHYASRRLWRPQLYHRDDIRSNSLPPMDVMHSSLCQQPPLRERYSSLDGYYSVANHVPTDQRTVTLQRDSYNRIQMGYEEPFRRKTDQWTVYHSQKPPPLVTPSHPPASQSPSRSSPLFDMEFSSEFPEGSSDFVCSKLKEDGHLSQYSPWSCGTISTCIHANHAEPTDVVASSSMELTDHGSCDIKKQMHLFEYQRKGKDEDPIIPFGEGPIISKWGAISRSSRTGYHTTDPVQATASQGSGTKPINFRDYGPYIHHGDSKWSSYGSDSSSSSSYLERNHLESSNITAQIKTYGNGEHLSVELQQAKSNSLLLQREANALATQHKWTSLDDDDDIDDDEEEEEDVEKHISFGLLNKEITVDNEQSVYTEDSVDEKSNQDIELELSALSCDDPDSHKKEILCVSTCKNELSNGTGNGDQMKQNNKSSTNKLGNRLLKQIAPNKKKKVSLVNSSCVHKTATSTNGVNSASSVMISHLVAKSAAFGNPEDPSQCISNGENLLNRS